ncbi:MAG: hypothetical protein NVS4B3_00710 [Gemmatimonadaceae bacterium]
MRLLTRLSLAVVPFVAPMAMHAQQVLPLKHAPRPTEPGISASDLMTRLYIFADDSMMGREAGTEGNFKATAYIEREVRKMGLQPAGDSGTFFQTLPFVTRSVAEGPTLGTGGHPLSAWVDFAPLAGGGAKRRGFAGAHILFAGALGDTSVTLSPDQIAGKFVIISGTRALEQRGLFVLRQLFGPAGRRFAGAAAVAVTGLELIPPQLVAAYFRRPVMAIRSPADTVPLPGAYLITTSGASALLGARVDSAKIGDTGRVAEGSASIVETGAPSRNVVAILQGSDPTLRNEYVAVGAHSDHIGTAARAADHDSLKAFGDAANFLKKGDERPLTPAERATIHINVDSLHKLRPARRDSINNGADDDGSGSVSVLEIAEKLAASPIKPKRSVLFVWHTGEEKGLLGSEWFTEHPTVPREAIVAQLNMDMVGRGSEKDMPGVGGPTFIQLVGSRRLSSELGDLVESVNRRQPLPFKIDYSMDADGHPANIYCRSDHYSYARWGIPVAFFTTGLHGDYHQLTDEPEYIDYDHMARVASLVADITVAVADLDHRVVVDRPKPDPHGACRQ